MSAIREIPERQAQRSQVAAALSRALPPESVLAAKEDLRPYECDGL